MSTPLFSILIVGYNCPSDIRRLLESLRRLPSWPRCEILVAENGDRELPAMEILAQEFGAALLPLPNPGFGRACNALASQARGENLLLANPDLVFTSDILPALADRLRDPGIGSVGPLLLEEDGSEQISWNLPMDLPWEFREAHGLQTRWRRAVMRRVRQDRPEGPWIVGFATAACLALRRDVFARIRGFDEAFFLNSEDIELGDRLRAAGLVNLVDPALSAVHGNSGIQGRNLSRFVGDRLDGKWLYLRRRYRGWRLVVARALWIESTLLRLGVGFLILRGSERTRLSGYARSLRKALFPR